MIGSLLQALFDMQQTGFIGAVALGVQGPRQQFISFPATLFRFSLQAGQLGFALFFSGGLLARPLGFALAVGQQSLNLLLQREQAGMTGQSLQALLDMQQTSFQCVFLLGALGLFQKLISLHFGLLPLFFPDFLGERISDLPIKLIAQRQQLRMIGDELQPLLDHNQAVFQRAVLLALPGLAQLLIRLSLLLDIRGRRWRERGYRQGRRFR